MRPDRLLFVVELIAWLSVTIFAVALTIWALFRSRMRRAVATTALCLWCVIAGAALMGSMWAFMTVENHNYQQQQIAKLPPGTPATDVELRTMGAIIFFVKLDETGRRILYATVLVPLIGTVFLLRKISRGNPPEKTKTDELEHELFSPYGR